MKKRYIEHSVRKDLKEKMVFVGGARQVGKTTFALSLLGENSDESAPAYLSWDLLDDRERVIAGHLPPEEPVVIFDEVHKYARWRNLLKGLFDKNKSAVSFMVTGSARLDYYRKGGDSLQGRYHYHRLHPFSARECDADPNQDLVRHLLAFGGFPEPFLKANDRFHRRWMRERASRVIQGDIRDLEQVKEISMLELLLHHLPACVGSPLSVNSLSKLLQVAHETVEHWLRIFERLYVCYRIAPFGARKIRAVRKEKKLYFWDWSSVPESGARFENLVAGQLLKYCHFVEDTEGHDMDLRFMRDTDGREIDFAVLRDGQPEFAVECKSGERNASPACRYFRERTDIPAFYQVHLGRRDFGNARSDTRVLPFSTFCRELSMP